jgi:hypothetical protein
MWIVALILIFIGTAGIACALAPYRPDWPAWTK